ncbi:bacteriophage abortive infection AbiH family protein [Metabacillus sp. HB246100]
MKLFICGNGFDLHHGFRTGYIDYRNFLLEHEHYSHALRAFEEFQYLHLSSTDKWSDLEQSLTINYEECIDDAIKEYYPDLNDDSDSRWYGIDIDLEEQTKYIFDFTGRYFLEWLAQIDFSDPKGKINLNGSDLYITFNYTSTLEQVYKIAPDNIFHIHGHIDLINTGNILDWFTPSFSTIEEAEIAEQVRVDLFNNDTVRQQIQFGSVKNNIDTIQIEMEEKYGHDDFYAVSIEPGIKQIIGFCEAASKNLEINYATLKSFISSNDIDEVIVIGHSIMGVDFPYYSDIIMPVLKDRRWIFYWHSKGDRDKIELFIKRFSLKDFVLIEW